MNARTLLRTTYIAGFLFSFQVALTIYINSSFLATKIPENIIGTLYIASAVLSVIGMFIIPRLINRFGTKPVLSILALVNIGNLLALVYSHNTLVIVSSFVLFFACNTFLYLGFDILIESWSDPVEEGRIRGAYLTAVNIGFMAAPLLGGYIVDRISFGALYTMAIFLILPVIFLLTVKLPNVRISHPSKIRLFGLIRKFMRNKNLGSVFMVNFILQFFYAWMVIYAPIYLHEQVGISWDSIGLLFTVMLSAFVLFQYVTGKIADRFNCERGLMILGLVIMGSATFFVTKAPLLTFWALAAVLFVTRIGASIVEVVTDSYFFRHVHPNDTGSIGFFRNTYPFAYIIAPGIASLIMSFAPMWILFILLGIICLLGVIFVVTMQKNHA